MTSSGGGGGDHSNEATGFATDGKILFIIDNLRIVKNASRELILQNTSGKTVMINEVERFESEIVTFAADGRSDIDLDFIYTPDLTGATVVDIPEDKVIRIRADGTVEDLDGDGLDLNEVTGFNPALASNKKIEIADNEVAFFASAQSTTVSQEGEQKVFGMPYAVEDGQSIVIMITNEGKLGAGPGLDVDVDLILSAYLK